MRAAVMRDRTLVVDEVPDPEPGDGQVLVRTLACGICGSDLHALQHGEELVSMTSESTAAAGDGMPPTEIMDLERDVVMGHEFAAEVVDVGPNTANCRPGDIVVSMPVVMDTAGIHAVGYSNAYPGGYGELMVLNDFLALKVPNGLPAAEAALTEPMAVGLHAVSASGLTEGQGAVVVGCGPVGLAVIAALRLTGAEPIVASDFSETRRSLASTMGADVVVDPRELAGVQAWREAGGRGRLHIFEAVGVPGILDQIFRQAPRGAHITVAGVCMEPDTMTPSYGIAKELSVQFALAYSPAEFSETLRRIAEGHLGVGPLITGRVPIEGVPSAFEELSHPDRHAKILVEP